MTDTPMTDTPMTDTAAPDAAVAAPVEVAPAPLTDGALVRDPDGRLGIVAGTREGVIAVVWFGEPAPCVLELTEVRA